MLPLPAEQQDELSLADWLELRALLADDETSSLGDLERVLTRASVFEDRTEALENKLGDVSKEIDQRLRACGGTYPFQSTGRSLQVTGSWRTSTYVFCLCLSYVRWNQVPSPGVYPARIFETLSREAARAYISAPNGTAVALRFGSPRVASELPSNFQQAITKLCLDHLGEGGGWPDGKTCTPNLRPKDGGLDIVAWRDWLDKSPGKIMLWGACATVNDWEDKTRELALAAFTAEWLASQPISPILRAFFVPHRIHADRWNLVSRQAGLIFERCRIASLVREIPESAKVHGKATKWVDIVLKRLRKS